MDSKRLKQVIGDYFNSNAKDHNTRVLFDRNNNAKRISWELSSARRCKGMENKHYPVLYLGLLLEAKAVIA